MSKSKLSLDVAELSAQHKKLYPLLNLDPDGQRLALAAAGVIFALPRDEFEFEECLDSAWLSEVALSYPRLLPRLVRSCTVRASARLRRVLAKRARGAA